MKKVIFLSIAALLATSGLSAAQMAGGPAPAPQRGRQDGERPDRAAMKARFKAEADTNKDGEVSADERQAFHDQMRAAHFAKKDQNSDGQLSQDEVPRMPAAIFEKLDTDKSGSLSADEMKQGPGHGLQRGHGRHGKRGFGRHGHFAQHMFTKLDENQDGKITKAEMRAGAERRFDKMDANKDGVITLEEVQAHKPHGKHAKADKPQAEKGKRAKLARKQGDRKRDVARGQAKRTSL